MPQKRRIIFVTGTRADFGKLKPLINKIENNSSFDCYVFVTGMHTLSKYGSTFQEVHKQGYKNVFVFMNQTHTTDADVILANTIMGFSNFVKEIKPDLVVIHGDRIETLACAIVGSFNNILVAHVEGGELSGTVDEIIRHAVTKLSHIHFVANNQAMMRLMQMGESEDSIFVIGSPDIDVMKTESLPSFDEVISHYDIPFREYAILLYHPVTTEIESLGRDIHAVVNAVIESKENYVVIYPNNDNGSDIIISEYARLAQYNNNFRIFPSLRFEYFLTLLKNAKFIIGNSSAGIREAEVYGIPSINIGSRQKNRSNSRNIIHTDNVKEDILVAIGAVKNFTVNPMSNFGNGQSSERFYEIMTDGRIWTTNIQKQFRDHYDWKESFNLSDSYNVMHSRKD